MTAPDDGRYGWEFKWDGVRAVAYVDGGRVRLLSRTGRDMTRTYPELAVLAQRADAPVIVDGEIIAIRHGRPDFALLQSRIHVRDPPAHLVRRAPVQLYLFDLLHHDGRSLLPAPYTERREQLAGLALDADPVRTTPWYPGGAADVLAASLAHALEGVVGKPLASAYHPGQRRDWIKIKNVRLAEVIICGWKAGQGRRADTIGSLLVGVWDGPRLRYAGHVGTGFTQAALADLAHQLHPLRRGDSPFGTAVPAPHARGAQWVQPQLVGEVAFTEWTPDRVMRHPSWRGLVLSMTLQLAPEEPEAGPWRVELLSTVVNAVTRRGPDRSSSGRPAVLAIDGRSNNGKTTLAARISELVPGFVVIHTDDIAWEHSRFDWASLLTDGILVPVHRGQAVSYRPPRWDSHGREGSLEVPAGCPLLIIEGDGAGRREVAHLIDSLIWVQADLRETERRNADRAAHRPAADLANRPADGAPFDDDGWMAEEIPFNTAQRTWERAGIIVCGTPEIPYDPNTQIVIAQALAAVAAGDESGLVR